MFGGAHKQRWCSVIDVRSSRFDVGAAQNALKPEQAWHTSEIHGPHLEVQSSDETPFLLQRPTTLSTRPPSQQHGTVESIQPESENLDILTPCRVVSFVTRGRAVALSSPYVFMHNRENSFSTFTDLFCAGQHQYALPCNFQTRAG